MQFRSQGGNVSKLASIALLIITMTLGTTGDLWAKGDPKAALRAGEVIVTSKKIKKFPRPGVKAVGVINASMERIWPLIDQCKNYTRTMKRILKSEEISRKGNEVICEITVDLPFPLGDIASKTTATHTVKPGKLYRRSWSLLSGDYQYNEGSWTLVPFEGSATRTLVVYETQVEPNTMIPDSIRAMAQKKTLPELFEHLRDQVK